MALTFKQFLGTINEDFEQEIQKLTSDIAMVDTQITQRTQPLMARKQQLQKMLAIKQKQAQAQAPKDDMAAASAQPQQAQGSQTTTPGGSGAQTPGMGSAR